MKLEDELDLSESERGFRVSIRGTVDPRLGVPWTTLLLVAAAAVVAFAVRPLAGLPFLAIGAGLFTPHVGRRIYGVEVDRGRLTLIGAETMPLHVFDTVAVDGPSLLLQGESRTTRLALEGSEGARAWLAERLNAALVALGDEDEVPQALVGLQRDVET